MVTGLRKCSDASSGLKLKTYWFPAQVVRAPVALAMVKLLRLLPEEEARAHLPPTLQGVANLLKNRLQRFR